MGALTDHEVADELRVPLLDSAERDSIKTPPQITHADREGFNEGCSPKWMYPFRCAYSNGICCLILASLLYSVLGVLIKILSNNGIPLVEILLIRSAFSATSCAVAIKCRGGGTLFGPKEGWGLLAVNSLMAFSGLLSHYVSLTLIPVGDSTALSTLSPLFNVLFSCILRCEAVNLSMGLGAFICFIGGVVVVRPPFLFGGGMNWSVLQIIGDALGFGSAIFLSLNYVTTSRIGTKVNELSIVFSLHLMTVLSLIIPLSLSFPSPPVFRFTTHDALILLAALPTSLLGNVFATRGLQRCDGVEGSTLQTVSIIFSYLLGLGFLDEKLTWCAFAGTCVIGLGIWAVAAGKAMALRGQNKQASDVYIHV